MVKFVALGVPYFSLVLPLYYNPPGLQEALSGLLGPWAAKEGRKSNLMKQRQFFWVQMLQKLVLMHFQESNTVVHGGELPRKNQSFSDLPGSRGID